MKKPILLSLLFCGASMVLYSQNKVGINTATPDSTLTVAGSTNVTSNLKVGNSLSLSTYPITRDNSAATFPSNMLYTDALGNVLSAPSKQRVNHVLVKSAADFPAASGGIITLTAGTLYEVNGTIVLTDKINLNGCYLIGRDANNDKLIYTPGSGELFTGTKGGTIRSLTMVANTTGSKLFNLDMTVTENLIVRDAIIASCKNVGLVKGGYITFFSVINYAGNTNGITYENISNLLLDNTAWFSTNAGTFEKLVGTFDIIEKLGGFSQATSALTATAFDVTGITTINEAGNLKNTAFMGTGSRVNGTFSKKWEVDAPGINTERDGTATGSLYITSTALTDITGTNSAKKVAGTTSTFELVRFTSPANNRLQYDGTKTRTFIVTSALSATGSSGTYLYSFYIYKNGVRIEGSRQRTKVFSSSGDIQTISIVCTVTLAPGDYVEVWAENNEANVDLTVQNLTLTVQ